MSDRRRPILMVPLAKQAGDVLPSEFVQCLWGGPVGILRSVEKNGVGLVWWLKHPGFYEVIDTKILRQADEPKVMSS